MAAGEIHGLSNAKIELLLACFDKNKITAEEVKYAVGEISNRQKTFIRTNFVPLFQYIIAKKTGK